ncbi:MAG: hypothetical protein AAF985_12270, partial [Bacteroidota bacterium]
MKPSYSNPFTCSQSAFYCCIARAFLLLGMVLSSFTVVQAQTWERFYDFSSHDFSKSIHQTADGGVLILGNIGNGDNESDVFLLKLDADGDVLWSKSFDGGSYDEAEQLIFTSDGHYLIAGYSFSFGNSGQFYLIKLDTEGNVVWERDYGGTDFDRARTLTETTNGNYVIAGWTRSPISGDVSQGPFGPVDGFDAWLIKTDVDGNMLWDLRFGGIERDEIHSIAPAPNDGVVMVTNTTSPELGASGADIYTLALDADGNLLWEEVYGGTEYEEVFSIIPTSDGGYAIGAITNSEGSGASDIYLIKTNDQGTVQWSQTYGGTEGEFGGFVTELSNGGFVVSGASQSVGSSFLDVYLIRTDATGSTIWQQHYRGGDNIDISTGLQVTDDGHFLIAAQRRQDDMTSILSSDLYILKTDAEGNTTTNSIIGTVLWDGDGDCVPDAGSVQLEDWLVEAIGEKTYFATTDASGAYHIEVDSGAYEVIIHSPHEYWSACMASNSIAFNTLYDTLTADFIISDVIDCPYLTVDVSTPYLNRCGLNRYLLRYCNTGPMEAGASFVNLTFHPDFILMDSELIPTGQNDNTYTFQVNALNSLGCDGFWIDVMLDCNNNIQGQTHEIIAEISPDEICTPVDPAWDGSSIGLEAVCEGDSVTFTIRNKGMDDMAAESYYIVIIDDLLSRTDSYQLPGSGDLTFVEHLEGQTLRLETPQSPLHPGESRPSIFVEACGTDSGGGISLGFVNQFPEDDGNAFVSIDAQESFETFLPNFLRAYPDGFGSINQIAPNTEIEYHIRFQHQGGDTLQRVIIEDQLPEELDVRTIRPGVSSHPYDFEVLGQGIVRFTFEQIQVPGDLINEPASHGFVKFK